MECKLTYGGSAISPTHEQCIAASRNEVVTLIGHIDSVATSSALKIEVSGSGTGDIDATDSMVKVVQAYQDASLTEIVTITGFSAGDDELTIATADKGDLVVGCTITIESDGGGCQDGTYTISNITDSGGTTTITVSEGLDAGCGDTSGSILEQG